MCPLKLHHPNSSFHLKLLQLSFFKFNFYLFFCHTMQHVGSWFPDQGSNPCPSHWEHGFLTTGHQGSPCHCFLMRWTRRLCFKISVYKDFQHSCIFSVFLVIEALTIKNGCKTENEIVKLQIEKETMDIDCSVVTGGGTGGNRNYLNYLNISRIGGRGNLLLFFIELY